MKHQYKYIQQRQIIAGIILTAALLLLAVIAPKIAAQGTESNCVVKNTIAYTSTKYAWSIRFPKTWKSNYQVCVKDVAGSTPADFTFSVRKNKRSVFNPLFTLHVWDSTILGSTVVTGDAVSQKGILVVTSETLTEPGESVARYAKDVPNVLKSFRWVNFGQLGDFLKKL